MSQNLWSGENYGWNHMEGFSTFEKFSEIDDMVPPIYVYPNDANRYKNKLQNSFQHGGISMEEILVPVLKMKGYG